MNIQISRIRPSSTGLSQVFITFTLEFYKCLQIISSHVVAFSDGVLLSYLSILSKRVITSWIFMCFITKKINEGVRVIKNTVSLIQNEQVERHIGLLVPFFHSELKFIKNSLFYII